VESSSASAAIMTQYCLRNLADRHPDLVLVPGDDGRWSP
jgi:hypothetical protein